MCWRSLFPCVLVCGVLLLASAAVAAVEYGLVQGTVQYADGLPGGRIAFTVKIGATTVPMTADEDGSFSGVVPVGKALFLVGDEKIPVTIVAGQVNRMALKAKRPGWIVSFRYPTDTPVQVENLAAEYKSPATKVAATGKTPTRRPSGGVTPGCARANGMRIAPGRYWFQKIPQDATAFACYAVMNESGVTTAVRRQWSFTDKAANRTLTVPVKRGPQVWLKLVDRAGNPVAHATVRGSLTFTHFAFAANRCWDTNPLPMVAGRRNLPEMRTDGRGAIFLGNFPARQYQLTLTSDTLAGSPVPFEVKSDGTVTLKQYALKLAARTVTQTVFDAAGKPAAQAQVFASYYWRGTAVLLQQQADAQGKVIWQELPPVRTITWGNAVRPSVIPAEGASFAAPLPAPVMQGWVNYRFKLADPDGVKGRIIGFVHGVNDRTHLGEYYEEAEEEEGVRQQAEWSHRVPCGTPFSLQLVMLSSPPRSLFLSGVYAPYVETDDPVPFPLALQEGVEIRGRFVDRDGAPVAGVSRLQVELVQAAEGAMPAAAYDPNWHQALAEYGGGLTHVMQRFQPRQLPGGEFTMTAFVPGAYRVLPDLYHGSGAVPPEFRFEAAPGVNEVTIRLPEPLCTVQAGTVVNWLTRCAPAIPEQMAVAAHTPTMPVYGGKDALLAYWYRPRVDALHVWDNAEGTEREQDFALRSLFISPTNAERQPWRGTFTLLPLLPNALQSRRGYGGEYYGGDGEYYVMRRQGMYPGIPGMASSGMPASSESLATPFSGALREQQVDLWTGSYLLPLGGALQKIEVPATGAPTIEVQMHNPRDAELRELPMTNLRINLPPADYNALRKSAAHAIAVVYDVPMPDERRAMIWELREQEHWINAPRQARTLSLQWLGVGVIRNVPIPAADEEHGPAQPALPAWSPGAAISGTLLKSDGKPYPNAALTVSLPGGDEYQMSLRLKTNAQGQFSVKGLLPGAIMIWSDNHSAGWCLHVPEKGLSNVTLRMAAQPVRIYANMHDHRAQVWWLPDGAPAQRLPNRWSEYAAHDLQPGGGMLWCIEERTGRSVYTRCMLRPGHNNIAWTQRGPSLGITFPLELATGLPGAVWLIGQGERAGISVCMATMHWAPSVPLGLVAGQIDAVPPGVYRLIVATQRGMVETTVTVTEAGGAVSLAYPPAKNTPANAE